MAARHEAASTRTTCPYCGTGCGVIVDKAVDGTLSVRGDDEHPANFGKLCPKGMALADTLGHDGRLLVPEIHGKPASWNDALALVAEHFAAAIADFGPDSVALYAAGQILTEDYYVANKLMKGFIGTANLDTNSRLCMASSVAGHKRAFGTDTVPNTYTDIEMADLVVLVGSNLAWCHPILYARLTAAKAARPEMKVVLIDPRRTVTADAADLHLPIKPGTDVALYLGLLAHLARIGRVDGSYVAAHVNGADAAIDEARGWSVERVAETCDLPVEDVLGFFNLVAATEKTLTIYSQGVNQSSAGVDKVNAILNTHLITGRIGKPGCGPFSVTGQPNAMGGREVGGLANMLAAHMELNDPTHREIVRNFWQAPNLVEQPGLKAVDLYKAVGDGRIKALWIMATNPVDSLPDADMVRAAIKACPFVVISEVETASDTAVLAHVRLPALAWGEKGGTVTNSERRISRQRAFITGPAEARADWEVLAEVGRRLGWRDAFNWPNSAAVFREYAALTGAGNDDSRDLDLSGLTGLSDEAYEAMAPVQWPVRAPGDVAGDKRFFADGGFYTPDRKGRMIAISYRPPCSEPDAAYPFILNTGRVRDQWHTMTRTARSARLANSIAEPYAEIHPDDAADLGIAPATLVRISSARAQVTVRAIISDRQRRGSVFVPMHWTDQNSSQGRVNALVAAHTDPISGQPESKFTPVMVAAEPMGWFAFALMEEAPTQWPGDYRAVARAPGGLRAELAGRGDMPTLVELAQALFGHERGSPDRLALFTDQTRGEKRAVLIENGKVAGLIFLGRQPVEASRVWLASRLGDAAGLGTHRILAGRAGATGEDPGRMVCGCRQVGERAILAALAAGCPPTLAAIGEATGAGTGCGSCHGDIRRLIALSQETTPAAAE